MKKILLTIFTCINLILTQQLNAQWKAIKSFTGGKTPSMTKDGNTFYACINNYGIMKSIDEGDHWSFVNNSLNPNLGNYANITAEGNKILIENYGYSYFFYSIDSGISFDTISPPLITSNQIYSARIYKGKIFLTDALGKIYSSFDDGTTWQVDTIGHSIYRIEISDARIFLIPFEPALDTILYTSLDTGITWLGLGNPDVSNYQSFTAKGDTLILATQTNQLRISEDFGATWNTTTVPQASYYAFHIPYLLNDTLFLITGDSIFNSLNLGTTWLFQSHNLGLYARCILHTGNSFLIGSSYHAIMRYNPATNKIVKKANGIRSILIRNIIAKGDTLFAHSDGGLFYSSFDNGDTWGYSAPFRVGNVIISGVTAYDNAFIYACHLNLVVRSSDWGLTWAPFDTLPGNSDVNKVLCHNGNIYYTTSQGLFRDSGSTGTVSNFGFAGYNMIPITAFGNLIYTADDNYVYSSIDGSIPQWKLDTLGLPNSKHFYISIASDTAVFIGSNKGIYRCYPPDSIWHYTGLYGKHVTDLAIFHNDVFAASEYKRITILRDYQGSKWDPVNFGLDKFNPLLVAAGDSFIFCGQKNFGVPYGGIYRRLRSQLQIPLGINDNSEDENTFLVCPNPATNELHVSGISNSTNTSLTIIDITGRVCFKNTISIKGNFNQSINITELPDGIFFFEFS